MAGCPRSLCYPSALPTLGLDAGVQTTLEGEVAFVLRLVAEKQGPEAAEEEGENLGREVVGAAAKEIPALPLRYG